MTEEEQLQIARNLAAGKIPGRGVLIKFGAALVSDVETPSQRADTVPETPPPFAVKRTVGGGIHLPREANGFLSRAEALGLIAEIRRVLAAEDPEPGSVV